MKMYILWTICQVINVKINPTVRAVWGISIVVPANSRKAPRIYIHCARIISLRGVVTCILRVRKMVERYTRCSTVRVNKIGIQNYCKRGKIEGL